MSVRISIADVRIGWTKEELKSTIYAHGHVEEDARHRTHGGYGIAIGLEDILPGNAATLFGRFRGHFAKPVLGIELVGCKVAVRSAVKNRSHGGGGRRSGAVPGNRDRSGHLRKSFQQGPEIRHCGGVHHDRRR